VNLVVRLVAVRFEVAIEPLDQLFQLLWKVRQRGRFSRNDSFGAKEFVNDFSVTGYCSACVLAFGDEN
jgi:hypothetical protein